MGDFSVLLVDDEREFVETLAKRLRKRNLDVQFVTSGREALEIIQRDHFDVAVVDVRMPEMEGITVLERMKQMQPLIEVILLTGYVSVQSGIEGMKKGAFDYLIKPTEIDKLVEKLYEAYEKKKAHEEKMKEEQIREMLKNNHPNNK